MRRARSASETKRTRDGRETHVRAPPGRAKICFPEGQTDARLSGVCFFARTSAGPASHDQVLQSVRATGTNVDYPQARWEK